MEQEKMNFNMDVSQVVALSGLLQAIAEGRDIDTSGRNTAMDALVAIDSQVAEKWRSDAADA